jgi:hypothetical protein
MYISSKKKGLDMKSLRMLGALVLLLSMQGLRSIETPRMETPMEDPNAQMLDLLGELENKLIGLRAILYSDVRPDYQVQMLPKIMAEVKDLSARTGK